MRCLEASGYHFLKIDTVSLRLRIINPFIILHKYIYQLKTAYVFFFNVTVEKIYKNKLHYVSNNYFKKEPLHISEF